MAVHDHPVFRVNGQAGHVAHQVGRQFGGELAAVLVAPQKLRGAAIRGDADDAQLGFRVIADVLKILAGAGDDEDLSRQGLCVEADGDSADDMIQIQIDSHHLFVQHIADVAAVALIPAQAVHIGGGFLHFLHKRSVIDIMHGCLLLYLRNRCAYFSLACAISRLARVS